MIYTLCIIGGIIIGAIVVGLLFYAGICYAAGRGLNW